jgi:hypothetical protein
MLACQSDSSNIVGAATLESAPGTSATNGLGQFESAIGVRPDVGLTAAKGRI